MCRRRQLGRWRPFFLPSLFIGGGHGSNRGYQWNDFPSFLPLCCWNLGVGMNPWEILFDFLHSILHDVYTQVQWDDIHFLWLVAHLEGCSRLRKEVIWLLLLCLGALSVGRRQHLLWTRPGTGSKTLCNVGSVSRASALYSLVAWNCYLLCGSPAARWEGMVTAYHCPRSQRKIL